jgi:hypothetical protein
MAYKKNEDFKAGSIGLPDPSSIEGKKSGLKKENKTQVKKSVKSKESNTVAKESSGGSLQELLNENLELSKSIFEQNKKIKRRLTTMVVINYLKLAIILAPIIIAIIYLPPLLGQVLEQYSDLLGGVGGKNLNIGDFFSQGINLDSSSVIDNVSPEEAAKIQEALKNSQR